MESRLYSIEETATFIKQGYLLALAADESALSQLPKGNWIGGTIPYFMDIEKGLFSQDKVFVNILSEQITDFNIKVYDDTNIKNITKDAYQNGYTILILPPFQKVQRVYALKSLEFENIYNNPIIGWIAGKDLDSKAIPKVYNGQNSEMYENKAVAVHIELPKDKFAQIDIINIFEKDIEGPEIIFLNSGIDVHNCLINGKNENLATYIKQNNIDIRLPLMSSYKGIDVNVSIKDIDYDFNIVSFYAPVFQGRNYHFSKHIDDYAKRFEIQTNKMNGYADVSFNCIHNYMYGELENKNINNITGPFTFGEIAYHLLNQTLVTLKILDKKNDEK